MATYTDLDYQLNTVNKDIRLAEDVEAINNSIRNILLTNKNTVPGNPAFGCNIEELLFEELDEITFALIEDVIINELETWETRIIIREVTFNTNYDYGQLVATIQYEILETNEIESTLVKFTLL